MNAVSDMVNSLSKLHPFSLEQLQRFIQLLEYQNLKKKECLIKPGQVSSRLIFINKGSFRHYTLIEHSEHTINFFTEGQWVADIDSLLAQKPSENYIEALEDSEIASISLQNIHRLMDIHPAFRMLNGLIAGLTISSTHLASISKKSPDTLYNELLVQHPDWITRFPQMHIASYLGITPETLSRVRARIA